MNELLGKLVDVGYDFVGVVIPGIFATCVFISILIIGIPLLEAIAALPSAAIRQLLWFHSVGTVAACIAIYVAIAMWRMVVSCVRRGQKADWLEWRAVLRRVASVYTAIQTGLGSAVARMAWPIIIGLLWPTVFVVFYDGLREFAEVIDRGLRAGVNGQDIGLIVVVLVLLGAYVVGHCVLWLSKLIPEVKVEPRWKSWTTHSSIALSIAMPLPNSNYKSALQEVYKSARDGLGINQGDNEWIVFFQVAKNYVMQNTGHTYIGTYQTRYTLHRSISVVAASGALTCGSLVFLASLVSGAEVAGVLVGLSALAAVLVILATVFAGSYVYYWLMFGDSVVTETYALLQQEARRQQRG